MPPSVASATQPILALLEPGATLPDPAAALRTGLHRAIGGWPNKQAVSAKLLRCGNWPHVDWGCAVTIDGTRFDPLAGAADAALRPWGVQFEQTSGALCRSAVLSFDRWDPACPPPARPPAAAPQRPIAPALAALLHATVAPAAWRGDSEMTVRFHPGRLAPIVSAAGVNHGPDTWTPLNHLLRAWEDSLLRSVPALESLVVGVAIAPPSAHERANALAFMHRFTTITGACALCA